MVGQAAKMAPPPSTSQTWLPSQVGPLRLMRTRRSSSVRATKGSNVPTPRSMPPMTAKPISSDTEEGPPDEPQGFVVEWNGVHRELLFGGLRFGVCKVAGLVRIGSEHRLGGWTCLDDPHHQPHHDDGEYGVEGDEESEADREIPDVQARGCVEGREHALDHPGLPAELGHEPARLDREPRERQRHDRAPERPAVGLSSRCRLACQNQKAKKAMKKKPTATMMRKLQNSDQRSGTVPSAAFEISFGGSVLDIGTELLQQQRVAEILGIGGEGGAGRGVIGYWP